MIVEMLLTLSVIGNIAVLTWALTRPRWVRFRVIAKHENFDKTVFVKAGGAFVFDLSADALEERWGITGKPFPGDEWKDGGMPYGDPA